MIEFKLPRLGGRTCNVCHEAKEVIEITFRSDYNNSGHTVAICKNCRKNLAVLLKAYDGE